MSDGPADIAKKVGIGLLVLVGIVIYLFSEGDFEFGEDEEDDPFWTPKVSEIIPIEAGAKLAERLSAAHRAQDVCYGWRLTDTSPADTSTPTTEIGSNLGSSGDPTTDPARCPRWMMLGVDYSYSYSADTWDAVDVTITSNLPSAPDKQDLAELGVTETSLSGEDPGGTLADAVAALPLLASEKSGVPPVPAQTETGGTPPAGDELSSSGDGRGWLIALTVLLIGAGLVWILIAFIRTRRRRDFEPAQDKDASTSSSTPPTHTEK